MERSVLGCLVLALLFVRSPAEHRSTCCSSLKLNETSCAEVNTLCTFSQDSTVLECQNVTRLDCPSLCADDIKVVRITGAKFKSMNAARLPFCNLTSLSIRFSDLMDLNSIPSVETLTDLDISNNTNLYRFSQSAWEALKSAANLVNLTLSNNSLGYIPEHGFQIFKNLTLHSLKSIDLTGNEWSCACNFSSILDIQNSLRHANRLKCFVSDSSWTLSSFSIVPRETVRKHVSQECKEKLPKCSCKVNAGDPEVISYSVQIDCANKSLHSLPNTLPKNTAELDVSNNHLSSIDQLANVQLKTLIADSNQIRSLRNLSGSSFMSHFSRLSLRNNRIQPEEIPLDEIVMTSSQFNHKFLYLYNNSWECSCKMATTFREWLLKNRHIVNDSSLLLCSNGGKKVAVLHLLPQSACPSVQEEEDSASITMYYILSAEVVLLVLLFVKVGYDSWRYIHHDELPWIATKLP